MLCQHTKRLRVIQPLTKRHMFFQSTRRHMYQVRANHDEHTDGPMHKIWLHLCSTLHLVLGHFRFQMHSNGNMQEVAIP